MINNRSKGSACNKGKSVTPKTSSGITGNFPKAQQLVQSALEPLRKEKANYEELLEYLKRYVDEARFLKSRVEAAVAKAVIGTTLLRDLVKHSPDDHAPLMDEMALPQQSRKH